MTSLSSENTGQISGFKFQRLLTVGLLIAVFTVLFYSAFLLFLGNQPVVGLLVLVVAVCFGIVFSTKRLYAHRFILPGIAAVLIFIAFPVGYTVYLGFTNFSSFNLLSHERVREIHLAKKIVDQETSRGFSVWQQGDTYRLYITGKENGYLSEPFEKNVTQHTVKAEAAPMPSTEKLSMRDTIKLRKALGEISVQLPDGVILKNSGLRKFAAQMPEFRETPEGVLISNLDGSRLFPNSETGFYTNEMTGEHVSPGWRVYIGLTNFKRIFQSEGIRAPMFSIFLWTCLFALLSVGLTFILGLALAVTLQWPHLRGKAVYRILLILPYAVPAFISILIFRGLFNQNFGEINMILNGLFGIRPSWMTDGGMARTMLVIVNVWLGYPYMMLLAMGFLQSVPEDHKKAATLEGASALLIFRKITFPQILPPFLPLLVASFAFNFNNIVLVLLLTRGLPDIPGTIIPAGQTDILGSFTYRIAFQNAGQEYGLAGAITLIIFVIVAALAYANFVAMRRQAAKRAAS
ncbi:Maltose transport system permease protein MalF [Pseudovibrio sp. W64]|uniref:maltose ABC transporter permease MalF n=1 Tax=Pseudovibrio sp. W64 TaxID=1735583 RepID=UPI0007AE44D6|nr:maltose ABC transporter permease MalF [Pseudovibrio sp. W64]KZK81959.1 Maltose transport system permease protein MalF [Pseudovibrio sp. W64]